MMAKDVAAETAELTETPARGSRMSRPDVPKMTVGTSEEYFERTAVVLSHAMLPNVLWRLFFPADTDSIGADGSSEKVLQTYHSIVKEYLLPGTASGAFIAEASDSAACAAWWPPGSHQPPKQRKNDDQAERERTSLMATFEQEIEKVKTELIWSRYGQEYWLLGLLARDPRKKAVPGVVTAVLQPFIDQAAAGGQPIWLSTTSEHARDIYLHFGWQMVRVVTLQGHSQWCMILYPPSQEKE